MIYQRYRLGTHATKCASYASSTASSAAASPQTVLSTSAVTSSHTLLGTHLVTSVVTSSRRGWTAGTTCSTSVQVGSSTPVTCLPTTTVSVVQSGSAWHLWPTTTVCKVVTESG